MAVVGAGLAGLRTATLVAGEGRSVVVLEARDRVGGRTLSVPHEGGPVDVGAQFIGPTHRRLAGLASELGVATHPTWLAGRRVLERHGRISTYTGTIPSLPLTALVDLQLAMRRLDRLAGRTPLDRPETAPHAAERDALSFDDWARAHVWTGGARDMLDALARSVFGAEPAELSLLYFLFYVRSCEGMISLADDAQHAYFVGGSQQISTKLAAALGERVRLGSPVRSVSQDGAGVTIATDGEQVRARRCVIAIPPPLVAGIRFDPPLEPDRDRLIRSLPMGATMKVVATYDRPFWRERGLSGESVSADGPVTATFDDTSPDGSRPALLGFVVGDAARAWARLPQEGRREAAASAFARLFGPEAATPTGYVDFDWSAEPWTGGCPVAISGPGTMLGYAPALRAPAGRVHWAGTETASEWCGYMEGALQSAERAAAEVLAAE